MRNINGFIQKRYYDIHGEFPIGNQALPADGVMFYLDDDLPEDQRAKPCMCSECVAQREWSKIYNYAGELKAKYNVKPKTEE